MKLYELATTPNARRVNLFLAEKGITVERVQVDVRAGENLTPEFRAKSANGRIPLLELDDGGYLCESVAICRYFDELYPDELALFGDSPLDRARVEMWHRIVELDGLIPAFQAFRNLSGVYRDREHCVPAWGEESRARLQAFLPRLEQRLGESDYLAGARYSIADIAAYVLIGFLPRLDISVAELPQLQRWLDRLRLRPALAGC
ncbi:glutathione S-transferase [Zobellella denitrificans]|jgi:glutathione S-transferase|uniref:Glutathione S-transferase n=1 Tax=Zobellella denitrificans TaxID=347534 RepID=A0A231MY44_9GAMM|nr:glutathione S-transferase family protein [Zobellella denitrificans]ATG74658.1 glutathione S-transferase [Zobellella denitrificans]OXS15171.1 glutathione S-transferase [Zobellella denitrificans]